MSSCGLSRSFESLHALEMTLSTKSSASWRTACEVLALRVLHHCTDRASYVFDFRRERLLAPASDLPD
jgi:hypothetical protein